jgi:hypothetical protein
MIGQHDDRIDREGMRPPRRPDGLTEGVDVIDQRGRCPVGQRDGEEIRSAREKISPVSDHEAM